MDEEQKRQQLLRRYTEVMQDPASADEKERIWAQAVHNNYRRKQAEREGVPYVEQAVPGDWYHRKQQDMAAAKARVAAARGPIAAPTPPAPQGQVPPPVSEPRVTRVWEQDPVATLSRVFGISPEQAGRLIPEIRERQREADRAWVLQNWQSPGDLVGFEDL